MGICQSKGGKTVPRKGPVVPDFKNSELQLTPTKAPGLDSHGPHPASVTLASADSHTVQLHATPQSSSLDQSGVQVNPINLVDQFNAASFVSSDAGAAIETSLACDKSVSKDGPKAASVPTHKVNHSVVEYAEGEAPLGSDPDTLNDYTVGECIGKGAYGTVNRATITRDALLSHGIPETHDIFKQTPSTDINKAPVQAQVVVRGKGMPNKTAEERPIFDVAIKSISRKKLQRPRNTSFGHKSNLFLSNGSQNNKDHKTEREATSPIGKNLKAVSEVQSKHAPSHSLQLPSVEEKGDVAMVPTTTHVIEIEPKTKITLAKPKMRPAGAHHPDAWTAAQHEKRILQQLSAHPNIVRFIEMFDNPLTSDEIHIVTELMEGGELLAQCSNEQTLHDKGAMLPTESAAVSETEQHVTYKAAPVNSIKTGQSVLVCMPIAHLHINERMMQARSYSLSRPQDAVLQDGRYFWSISPHKTRLWMVQIVDAVRWMHSVKGISHSDIKLDNIMLSGDGLVAKLVDFGQAKQLTRLDDDEGMVTQDSDSKDVKTGAVVRWDPIVHEPAGSSHYMCPEMCGLGRAQKGVDEATQLKAMRDRQLELVHTAEASASTGGGVVTVSQPTETMMSTFYRAQIEQSFDAFAHDVFALGVCLFALLSGCLPFAGGRNELDLYRKIATQEPDWSHITKRKDFESHAQRRAALELVQGCMQKLDTKRWTMAQVCASPFWDRDHRLATDAKQQTNHQELLSPLCEVEIEVSSSTMVTGGLQVPTAEMVEPNSPSDLMVVSPRVPDAHLAMEEPHILAQARNSINAQNKASNSVMPVLHAPIGGLPAKDGDSEQPKSPMPDFDSMNFIDPNEV